MREFGLPPLGSGHSRRSRVPNLFVLVGTDRTGPPVPGLGRLGSLIEPLRLQATEAIKFVPFCRPRGAMPSLLHPIHRSHSRVHLRGPYK
jgi:hypothetical protein